MEKKISDKQVFDLISEFAKTSQADISPNEIKKEFSNDDTELENEHIIVVPGEGNYDNTEDNSKNEQADSSEIIPLLHSIHTSISDLKNIQENESLDNQVEEILSFLKNNLDEKILSIEQKLNEIIFKNQSTKFLLEDTKNILSVSKQQQIELEKIQEEVNKTSKLFENHQPFTPEDRKSLKEDFLKITTRHFEQLDNRINNVEKNLAKISSNETEEMKSGYMVIPKWFLYLSMFLMSLLFFLFFFLLNKNSKPSNNRTKANSAETVFDKEIPEDEPEVSEEVKPVTNTNRAPAKVNKSNPTQNAHSFGIPYSAKQIQNRKFFPNVSPPSRSIISTPSHEKNDLKNANSKKTSNTDVYFGND